eukprot:scaffold12.g8174.t1
MLAPPSTQWLRMAPRRMMAADVATAANAQGSLRIAQRLLAAGASTPLHRAAQSGQAAVVRSLLRRGADPLRIEELQYTPLHFAADQGHTEVCMLLLEAAPQAVAMVAGSTPAALAGYAPQDPTPLELALLNPDHPRHMGVAQALLKRGELRPAGKWLSVPARCPGLGEALPAVLARSPTEAGLLVARMLDVERHRLRAAALALAHAQHKLGLALPAPVVAAVLAASAQGLKGGKDEDREDCYRSAMMEEYFFSKEELASLSDAMEAGTSEEAHAVARQLAHLAVSAHDGDWASLFPPLLAGIFRRVLEHELVLAEAMRAWQALALVCKGWRAALLLTPLCLELTLPAHLSPPARAWLAAAQIEALLLGRAMEPPPPGADAALLGSPEFEANSRITLRSLVNASLACLPLLPRFTNLQQVALFGWDEGQWGAAVDASLFRQLPKLNCLTVSGFFAPESFDTLQLPTALKHLTISNYNAPQLPEGMGDEDGLAGLLQAVPPVPVKVALPEGMQLELLSGARERGVKGLYVMVDLVDLANKCQELVLAAEFLVARASRDTGLTHRSAGGLDAWLQQLYKGFASAVLEGTVLRTTLLAFYTLALYAGHPESGAAPIDPDEFLIALREDLLPADVDLNPALEAFAEFVRDQPAQAPCFVLEMVRQASEEPKSLHFTTPVSNGEIQLLLRGPVWQVSWCDDPRVEEVLHDPQFISQSAPTLTTLANVPVTGELLRESLDLAPFTKLHTLLLIAKLERAAEPLARLPLSLRSFSLTAEHLEERRDFDAASIVHLTELEDLGLFHMGKHDMRAVPTSVRSIRLLNPQQPEGEPIGTGPSFLYPSWIRETKGAPAPPKPPPAPAPPPASPAADAHAAGSAVAGSSSSSTGSGGDAPAEAGRSGPLAGGGSSRGGGGLASHPLSRISSSGSFESARSMLGAGDEGGEAAAPSPAVAQAAEAQPHPPQGQPAGEPAAAAESEVAPEAVAELAAAAAAAAEELAAAPDAAAEPAFHPHQHPHPQHHGHTDPHPLDFDQQQQAEHHHGHGHAHGGAADADGSADADAPCADPFCPTHSGHRCLQVTLSDSRQRESVDLTGLLTVGFEQITIQLSPATDDAALLLLHAGSWSKLCAQLESSQLEVLEVNCHAGQVRFVGSGLFRPSIRDLLEGFQALERDHSSTWLFKSWDGATIAREGIHPGAKGFALMRRATSERAAAQRRAAAAAEG